MYNVQSVPALLMSHSTRVRGLKYFFSDFIFSISEVALYTSAWIEISTASRPRQRKSSRTLHECVDWNNSVTKADFNSARRTLHECVDWNSEWYWSSKMVRRSHSTRVRGLKYQRVHECIYHFRSHSTRVRGLKYWCWGAECGIDKSHSTRVRGLKLNLLAMVFILAHVALYTSAWIEIGLFKSIFEKRYCRTLHECVDWNNMTSSKRLSSKSRTLHECVDWNMMFSPLLRLQDLSHSTRVRGLKYSVNSLVRLLIMSHSTRVRGLKFENVDMDY